MKFKFIYTILFSILVWVLNTSDRTGKSTFTDCSACHGGSSSTTTVDSITLTEVATGISASKYKPGTAYTIKLYGHNSASLAKFGFQLKPSIGAISSPATNSKLTSNFWQHSTQIPATSGKYIINAIWTAPAAGSGTVTFQSWLNAVNGDNGSSGDAVSSLYSQSYLEQTSTTTTDTAKLTIAITVGTNPCKYGTSVTFRATPVNGGTNPMYQWKLNGNNLGSLSTSSTYTTSTLNNNDIVSCVLTSNLSGVIGTPASSNTIKMSVTGSSSIINSSQSIEFVSTSQKNIYSIHSPTQEHYDLSVYNLSGKLVYRKNVIEEEPIDFNLLGKGIYIAHFMVNNQVIIKKFELD